MSGPVPLRRPEAVPVAASEPVKTAARGRELLAILSAIRDGGLLQSPPAAAADRERHAMGLSLLELVEMRLREAVRTAR